MGSASSCIVAAAAVLFEETGAFIGFNGAMRCRLVTKSFCKWEELMCVFFGLWLCFQSSLFRCIRQPLSLGLKRVEFCMVHASISKCQMDFELVPAPSR